VADGLARTRGPGSGELDTVKRFKRAQYVFPDQSKSARDLAIHLLARCLVSAVEKLVDHGLVSLFFQMWRSQRQRVGVDPVVGGAEFLLDEVHAGCLVE